MVYILTKMKVCAIMGIIVEKTRYLKIIEKEGVSMSRNNRNNPNQNPNPNPNPNPATSADLLKDIWKVVKPNSRKNPSEEDVFEALELLVENNKKAIEAGKEQSRLLKEAEAKAREEQAKKDKEEIEKLKATHIKEMEDLKTAHKKELEKLKGTQPVSGVGEAPDLTILTDGERATYEESISKAAEELAAAHELHTKATKRRTASRLMGLF